MKSAPPSKSPRRQPTDFESEVSFQAPCQQVFDAIATIRGLRGWWTPITSGSAAPGGQLRFEFKGLDECIIMQVAQSHRPHSVDWICLMHTSLTAWNGTRITFNVIERTPNTSDLKFRHIGLKPALPCYDDCRQGWEHFLGSLVAYVEQGQGFPFGL